MSLCIEPQLKIQSHYSSLTPNPSQLTSSDRLTSFFFFLAFTAPFPEFVILIYVKTVCPDRLIGGAYKDTATAKTSVHSYTATYDSQIGKKRKEYGEGRMVMGLWVTMQGMNYSCVGGIRVNHVVHYFKQHL